MATREENLKKINEELELLSDEELEQVAGGAPRRSIRIASTNQENQNSLLQGKVPTYQPGVIIAN